MDLYKSSDYRKRKKDLRQILEKEGSNKKKLELNIYDFMVDAIEEHKSREDEKTYDLHKTIRDHVIKKTIGENTDEIRNAFQFVSELLSNYYSEMSKKNISIRHKSEVEKNIDEILDKQSSDFTDLLVNRFKEKDDYDSIKNITKAKIPGIKELGKRPAYLFVFGYERKVAEMNHYLIGGNTTRDCIGESILDISNIDEEILDIAYEDNAVIIDKSGKIVSTNTFIENFNVDSLIDQRLREMQKSVAKEYKDKFVYEKLGFNHAVNARHFASISLSYHLRNIPGVSIYTLSEETGTIRRFGNGNITFSMVAEEMDPYRRYLGFDIKK